MANGKVNQVKTQHHEISTVPRIGGKGHRFLTRSSAISLLATFVGIAASVTLLYVNKNFHFEHWLWEGLMESGQIPRFISCLIFGFFTFGLLYLILGYLFRCFPSVSQINIYEKDLLNVVTQSQTLPIQLNELLKRRRLGGINLLHTRLSKLWNGFCHGAEPTDLRTQNESLSNSDESSLYVSQVPLDISMWAMPVLGFIGTVWGAGGAVRGLAGAIIDVVAKGQLNSSTIPFLNEAFAGLGIAFSTTLLGLIGLIIVGFGRWVTQKTGTGAIMYVDSVSEDFISLLSYSGGGYIDGGGDSDSEVPLSLLPDRISRLALDTWRAGHRSKQFLEERVIEGLSSDTRNISTISISEHPYYVAMVEKGVQSHTLKFYRLAIGQSDGLFMFIQQLPLQDQEIDNERVRLLELNSVSRTAICPLSNKDLGIVMFARRRGERPSLTAGYSINERTRTLGKTYTGYLQSNVLNTIRLVVSTKEEDTDYVQILNGSILSGRQMELTGELRGRLMASDPKSCLIAVSEAQDEHLLAIYNCLPDTEPEMVMAEDTAIFNHCRFIPGLGYFLAISEDQEIHYAQYQYEANKSSIKRFEKLISCDAEVIEIGLLGSKSDCRLIYLRRDGKLYSMKIPNSKKELILSDCHAMALSEDGKHMITYQERDGLRAWGHRPESA